MLRDDPALAVPAPARRDLPRYALVYTTYGWDPFVEAMYDRNVARAVAGEAHVIADETGGAIDLPARCRKTSATPAGAAELGLKIAYHRSLFWHNIDYLYYIFFRNHPDYDYYIFLDYDALTNTDVDELVASVARQSIDFVGAEHDGELDDWTFARQHAGTYGPRVLDARISAVTILSRRALAHLFKRRQAMSAAPTEAQQAFWPICEAFVPSEIRQAGFVTAPLSQFGDVSRFHWWPPTLDETLTAASADAGFLHPVLDRSRYIRAMVRHAKATDFIRPGVLWGAIRSCPDRRWTTAFASELARRAVRWIARLLHRRGDGKAVGMGYPYDGAVSRKSRDMRSMHGGRAVDSCNRNGGFGIAGDVEGQPAPSRIHLANL